MAGTFSQSYIQIVFAVKGRQKLIGKEWKDKYIFTNKGQKIEIDRNEKYLFEWFED